MIFDRDERPATNRSEGDDSMEDGVTKGRSTVAGEVVAGVVGAGVAAVCVMPPILHFITGPLGPFIGGFVAASQARPGGRGRVVIPFTIATGLSSFIGVAAKVVLAVASPSDLPEWFPAPSTLLAILAGVWLYAAALASVGVAVSGAISRRHDAGVG
jgi:hypothetical protein